MVRICPECQSENEDANDFCKNCGINLNSHNDHGIYDNKLFQLLFCWRDKNTLEYRLAKTKVISWIFFLTGFIFFAWFYIFIYDVRLNVIVIIICQIIMGAIFACPALVIGFIFHKLL